MKLRLTALFWMMMVFNTPFSWSQESSTTTQITTAIQSADAAKLAESFHSTIDLLIPDNEGMYSNKQAEQIMKLFFKNNPVEKFTVNHQGNSNDGSRYIIGKYKSTNGITYMVYVLIKKSGEQDKLFELRFEKE